MIMYTYIYIYIWGVSIYRERGAKAKLPMALEELQVVCTMELLLIICWTLFDIV